MARFLGLFLALACAATAAALPGDTSVKEYFVNEGGVVVTSACPTCARCTAAGYGCFRCCVQDGCWCTCDGGGRCRYYGGHAENTPHNQ